LTPDQQSKLSAIEQSMHDNMDERMSTRDQFHNTVQQQVSSGTFDFNQIRPMLDAQIDDRAAAAHATINSLQQFFDTLNADQKSKLAANIKEHMDRMQERRDRWEQKKSDSNSKPQDNQQN
jgi:Spy/CpxP family protein refolding chaperone